MSRLVAATCPKCGAGVTLEPGSNRSTCGYCGVTSFVEPEPRLPASREPRLPVSAPKPGQSRAMFATLALGALLLLIAVGASAFVARRQPPQQPKTRISPTVVTRAQVPSEPRPKPAPAPDYYADASPLKVELERLLGQGLMVQEIILYQIYASSKVRDPKNPTHIDQYFLNKGEFNPPQPVTQGVSDKELPQTLFRLDDFDFSLVPKLVQTALREIQVENGRVTHIIVDRERRQNPRINAYVSNDRNRGGRVEFALNGTKRRVFKPF